MAPAFVNEYEVPAKLGEIKKRLETVVRINAAIKLVLFTASLYDIAKSGEKGL